MTYFFVNLVGILAILLQAPNYVLTPHLPILLQTSDTLLRFVVHQGGYLPTFLPLHTHSKLLVQICHGSPGVLVLVAVLRSLHREHSKDTWFEAEAMASKVVWKQGLLRKGLGVCHGLSGNAWGWLLLGRTSTRYVRSP